MPETSPLTSDGDTQLASGAFRAVGHNIRCIGTEETRKGHQSSVPQEVEARSRLFTLRCAEKSRSSSEHYDLIVEVRVS